MFCSKCGQKLAEDALFCQRCGAQTQHLGANNTAVRPSSNSTEFDREALKIYLGDVLSLECIKAHLEKRAVELEQEVANIRDNNYYQRYPVSGKDSYAYIHLFFDGECCYLAYVDDDYGGVYLRKYLNGNYRWLPIEGNLGALKWSSQWRYAMLNIGGFFDNLSRKSQAKQKFRQAYESFKVDAPMQYQANLGEIDRLEKVRQGVIQELNQVNKLLKQTYAVNLIPDSFRYKLYAIYYLHIVLIKVQFGDL